MKKRRTKKELASFSRKSTARAKAKAKTIKKHLQKPNVKKNDRAKANKSPIEAEIGMHVNGILYRSREFGRSGYFVSPSSKRADFTIFIPNVAGASEGELVETSLTRLPDGHGIAQGRITRVFGAADSKQANYDSILCANGIEVEFGVSVAEEAERVSRERISEEGREDLRGECIFTLDGADAKDLDDAISLKRTKDGYELGVHIADVSHYVRERSELDREAMKRGTSVYFTDKVVPMLPRSLSNGACSLDAGSDKYALSALISLDADGNMTGAEIKKSIIRSVLRGVYSEANDLLENGTDSEYYDKYKHVYPTLCEMYPLFKKREEIAHKRGYVELDSVESVIILDNNGMPEKILRRERGESEKLIEQFMLLANEAVARYMSIRNIPCVYRIHEKPDEEKVRALINLCSNWGIDASSVACGGAGAASYEEVLAAAREKGISDVVSDAMLRTFMKARYSEIRSSHFGLALDYYAHFTSPIRRYPDLAVHRILKAALDSSSADARRYASFAREAAVSSSEAELRALNAERAIDDLYKTLYMKKHEGEEYEARISSVQSFGFFCVLDNTCEGLVPVGSLDGFFVYSEEKNTLASKKTVFSAGDVVRIRVKYADTVRRKVEFEFLEMLSSARASVTETMQTN